MAYGEKTYNVVLECHSCSVRFEMREISFDKVRWLPIVSVCPHCGAAGHASTAAHHIKELKSGPK